MSPRCPACQTHHLPDDAARCRNAREVGVKLNRVLSIGIVPVVCESSKHEQFKQSAEAFLRNTDDWMMIENGRTVDCHGTCHWCGKAMSYVVRSSDARLKAAIELLKNDQ